MAINQYLLVAYIIQDYYRSYMSLELQMGIVTRTGNLLNSLSLIQCLFQVTNFFYGQILKFLLIVVYDDRI